MAIHSPPNGHLLDVCFHGARVGSQSVRKWIEREQPLLVLCGHIHESPDISGSWSAEIGKTTVIQPGQTPNGTTMVLLDIHEGKVNASRIGKSWS